MTGVIIPGKTNLHFSIPDETAKALEDYVFAKYRKQRGATAKVVNEFILEGLAKRA